MVLKIHKLNQGNYWVFGVLVTYFLTQLLVNVFHLPRVLLLLGDFSNLLLFVAAIKIRRKETFYLRKSELWLLLYLGCGLLSYLLNVSRLEFLVLGLRNGIRMPIFFFSCLTFLKKKDIYILLAVVEKVFWVSLPLCVIERFFIHYGPGTIVGDMVGGLFWGWSGVNALLNVVLCMTFIYVITKYLSQLCSFRYFLFVIVAGLGMAALAELKVVIVELVMLMVIISSSFHISKTSLIKLLAALGSFVLIFSFVVTLFVNLNGTNQQYANQFTLQGIWNNVTRESGYDGVGDLNRLTGIPTIQRTLFKGQWGKSIFGIGLGNAEYTQSIQTIFYQQYRLIHYQYFHATWLFIESGYMGLISFSSFFLYLYIRAKQKLTRTSDRAIVKSTIWLSLLLFFYNTSLRIEMTGLVIYMVLSLISLPDERSSL